MLLHSFRHLSKIQKSLVTYEVFVFLLNRKWKISIALRLSGCRIESGGKWFPYRKRESGLPLRKLKVRHSAEWYYTIHVCSCGGEWQIKKPAIVQCILI